MSFQTRTFLTPYMMTRAIVVDTNQDINHYALTNDPSTSDDQADTWIPRHMTHNQQTTTHATVANDTWRNFPSVQHPLRNPITPISLLPPHHTHCSLPHSYTQHTSLSQPAPTTQDNIYIVLHRTNISPLVKPVICS